MSFVLFFRGMLAVLLVFAVTMYFLTGSFWTAFWQTALCAVLLQVGYFVGVVLMIWRSDRSAVRSSSKNNDIGTLSQSGDGPVKDHGKLPGAPFPH